jgi:predicted adenine nucleotide alpha hydrolase (AANH) superfamily ATPase
MKKHKRQSETKTYTIIFFPNNNTITRFESEYVGRKEPNNGVIEKFAKRNGIQYKYWILKK